MEEGEEENNPPVRCALGGNKERESPPAASSPAALRTLAIAPGLCSSSLLEPLTRRPERKLESDFLFGSRENRGKDNQRTKRNENDKICSRL